MKQWGNCTKTFRKELFSTLLWLEDLAPANRLWKWYADLTERSDSRFFLVFHWWFVARRFQQQPEVGQLSWLALVFFSAFAIKNTSYFHSFFHYITYFGLVRFLSTSTTKSFVNLFSLILGICCQPAAMHEATRNEEARWTPNQDMAWRISPKGCKTFKTTMNR